MFSVARPDPPPRTQSGFQRLIVAQDALDPLTIVTMPWWDSEDAVAAWSKSQEYRAARSDSGGQGLEAMMELAAGPQ